MSRSSSTLSLMYDFLLQPVPFLPKRSFIKPSLRLSRGKRRKAKSSLAEGLSRTIPFALSGTIEPGLETKYAIQGQDFVVDKDTWIFGEISMGKTAVVKGVKIGGANFARKVLVDY